MKNPKIEIAGREFALAFTLDAMCTLTDSIKDFRLEKLAEYVKSPKGMLDMVYALAEQGELLHNAPHAFVVGAWDDEIASGKAQRRGEQRPTDGKGLHAGASVESEPCHDVPDACREHSCGDPCAPQCLGSGLAQ